MAVHTIRNNTGMNLQLWDVGTQIANLANGVAIHSAPTTITSITAGGVIYANKVGAFLDDDSYSATFHAAAIPLPARVVFTGNNGNVTFS